MATITKDKNIYVITIDSRTYKLNCDNNEVVGVKGIALQRKPAGWNDMLIESRTDWNVFHYLYNAFERYNQSSFNQHRSTVLEALSVCDKAQSLGYAMTDYDINSMRQFSTDWKNFAKDFSADRTLTYEVWVTNGKVRTFRKKYNIPDTVDLNNRMIFDFLECRVNEKNFSYAVWAVQTPLAQLMLQINNFYIFVGLYNSYVRHCEILNLPLEKEKEVSRLWYEIAKTYNMKIDEIQMQKIKTTYDKYRDILAFEDNELEVKIPTCPMDFKIEAAKQRNCVADYIDRVARGETLVVFIRKKSNPNASYITCEVGPNSFNIIQYYKRGNNHVGVNDLGYTFREKYLNHMQTKKLAEKNR